MAREFLGEEFWSEVSGVGSKNHPKADVIHSMNEVIVVIDLPGIANIDAVDIRVEGETLFIKGTIPTLYKQQEHIVTERHVGSFERTIPLGVPVIRQRSRASYRKGVLEIRLPMVAAGSSTRRIRISDN
ncbi:HSP20 family protein [Marininema halotolerans]|uniref:HSP20 family protein n=2 Tax=Marininema halotolerans TaxID=1155944 RepID=A0A1I6UFB9_9BACL|nr:HSP20 family protein [Marininema halotolerans]